MKTPTQIACQFDGLDDVVKEAGMNWYNHAFATAYGMKQNLHPTQVVGLIACLSPQASWARNLEMVALTIADKRFLQKVPAPRAAKAHAILRGELPLDPLNPAQPCVLKGPKDRAFYANINGHHHDWVTIDRHMIDILLTTEEWPSITARRYKTMSTVILQAADIAGVQPSTMQAALWINHRREKGNHLWAGE